MSHEVAAPGADDPDTPTEAVGSWPTIDLGRLGLPPLGWVFVAVALFVAATRLRTIGGAPADIVPDILLSSIQATVVVLLPAALLWRLPGAIRTHTLLLTGLALVAAAQLVMAANQLWPLFHSDDGTRSTFDAAWPLLTPAGGILIGLGLLRLRVGADRLSVLAAIVVTYVGIGVASYLIGAGTGTLHAYDVAILVIVPAAAAVAVWVPVAAWLESDTPQAFWGLLAVALPLGVIVAPAHPPGDDRRDVDAIECPVRPDGHRQRAPGFPGGSPRTGCICPDDARGNARGGARGLDSPAARLEVAGMACGAAG